MARLVLILNPSVNFSPPWGDAGLFHSQLKIVGGDGVMGLWGGGERIFLR
jgi:hypothetical protein